MRKCCEDLNNGPKGISGPWFFTPEGTWGWTTPVTQDFGDSTGLIPTAPRHMFYWPHFTVEEIDPEEVKMML